MKDIVRTRTGAPVIIAPVKRTEEILPILRAGAKEVYGGVMDSAWDEALGQYVEMNRRSAFGSAANLRDCSELCEAVRICTDQGAEFHFTLNALQIPGHSACFVFQAAAGDQFLRGCCKYSCRSFLSGKELQADHFSKRYAAGGYGDDFQSCSQHGI